MAVPRGPLVPAILVGLLLTLVAVLLLGQGGESAPGGSREVAAATTKPGPTDGPEAPSAPPSAPSLEPAAPTEPPPPPDPTPGPSAPVEPPVTGLVTGAVSRSSLDLTATYDVHAALTVFSGELDVSTTIVARNDGDRSIDRLELNTVAARLGKLRITGSSVDDRRVRCGSTTRPSSCRSAGCSSPA